MGGKIITSPDGSGGGGLGSSSIGTRRGSGFSGSSRSGEVPGRNNAPSAMGKKVSIVGKKISTTGKKVCNVGKKVSTAGKNLSIVSKLKKSTVGKKVSTVRVKR